jgi:cytoskeletal protein CcmA (bactofilin family)
LVFRKRKDSGGGQGYDRISKLIEDRQRELADDPSAGEDLDDDTILLGTTGDTVTTPAATFEPSEKSVSLFGVRGPAPAAPVSPSVDEAPEAETDEDADFMRSAHPSEDRVDRYDSSLTATAAYAAPAVEQPIAPDATPEPPAMPVPDIRRNVRGATLVAAEATWEGKLRSEGDIRVEGVVRGEIETASTLVIAPEAQVHGTVRARNIMIGGDVEGDVTCDERLEILPGGSARGQINSGTLVVHEGAYIDSRFQMRRE